MMAALATAALRRGTPRWYVQFVLPGLVVAAGLATLVTLGSIADVRWEQHPIVTLEARAVDPSELLRGSYVDLEVTMPPGSESQRKRVRFLAAEDDARMIEGVLRGRQRGQQVQLEARLSPSEELRPIAVITPDGRRFPTR
jgi:hypothetical protein